MAEASSRLGSEDCAGFFIPSLARVDGQCGRPCDRGGVAEEAVAAEQVNVLDPPDS